MFAMLFINGKEIMAFKEPIKLLDIIKAVANELNSPTKIPADSWSSINLQIGKRPITRDSAQDTLSTQLETMMIDPTLGRVLSADEVTIPGFDDIFVGEIIELNHDSTWVDMRDMVAAGDKTHTPRNHQIVESWLKKYGSTKFLAIHRDFVKEFNAWNCNVPLPDED